MLTLTPPIPELGKQVFHKVIPTLLTHHDDGLQEKIWQSTGITERYNRFSYQLYTEFRQATRWITYIIFKTKELTASRLIVAGIIKETSLEEGYVYEG